MKPWYKSKQFWVGAMQLIASVALFMHDFFTQHQTISTTVTLSLFLNGLAMLVLRWLTDQPISSFDHKLDPLRPRIAENMRKGRYRKL
jgi:hypothetical protein